MSLEEELAHLRADLQRLQAEHAALNTALAAAEQRIAELEAKKTPPPPVVKARVPARPKQARKTRAPEHTPARPLETPTRVVEQRLTCCPACQGHVSGGQMARRRQGV